MSKEYINNSKSIIKYCRVCRVELTRDNTILSVRKAGDHICRKCYQVYVTKYIRLHRIGTERNGKFITLWGNKRPYPLDKRCEICKREKQLGYHHWDDANLMKGMWICNGCHYVANGAEKLKTVNEYFNLKEKIEREN